MKKHLLPFCAVTLFASGAATADTLLGVYVGGSVWNEETEGGFSDNPNITSFDYDDETRGTFYVALEHPIPFVPNIKLRRTDMDTGGVTTLSSSFTFGGEIFTGGSTVINDVELTNTDIILYYEFFDNDLVSFDFGINGKYVDGNLIVTEQGNPSMQAEESFSGVVPMLYSRLAVGLPLTGFGAYAEGSYLSFDDHTLTDLELALTYTFIDNAAVDVTAQLGYRQIAFELDDLDNIYTDIEFEGVFAGIEVHF